MMTHESVHDQLHLRDVFAIGAMIGLAKGIQWTPGTLIHEDALAREAYALAEAMLKIRQE